MKKFFRFLVVFLNIFKVKSDIVYVGHTKSELIVQSSLQELQIFESVFQNGVTQDDDNSLILQSQGLYLLSCILLIEIRQYNNIIKVLANLNEGVSDNSLQSWSTEQTGLTSIKVNGLFRANKNDTLRVYIESTNGNIVVKSHSQLNLVLLSTYDIRQFVSASLLNDVFVEKKAIRFPWTSINIFSSFITTNLFNRQGGGFVAEKQGIYIVLGNFIFNNKQDYTCTTSVIIFKNSNEVLIESTMMASAFYFTINIARSIALEKGDRVWLNVTSSCLKLVLSNSTTYGIGYLNQKEGLSVSLYKIESYIGKDNWNLLDLFNYGNNKNSGFSNRNVHHASNFVSFKEAGLVLVTINLIVKAPFNTTIKLAVTKNVEAMTLNQKDYFGETFSLVTQSFSSTSQQTISFVSLLEVAQNDNLRLNIYSSTSEQWFVLSNSTVSLVLIYSNRIPQVPELKLITTSLDWKLLSCIKDDPYEELIYINKGLFNTHQSKVFFVSIFVLVTDNLLEDEVKVALIYNEAVYEKQKILLVSEVHNVNSKTIFKLFSTLVINIGQNVGIFIQSSKLLNLKVSCSISFSPLGSMENVIGFQASLDNPNFGQNSIEVARFYDSSQSEFSRDYHYNNNNFFSYGEGLFKAPVTGIYLISAIIIVKDLIAYDTQSAYVTACLNVNNKHSIYCTKRLVASFKSRVKRSFTLSLVGPIKLSKEDKTNLVVYSNFSGSLHVAKFSSFSIVLINDIDDNSAKGFLVNIPKIIVRKTENQLNLINGWSSECPSSGCFECISKDNPVILNLEKVVVHYGGTYVLSLQIHLKNKVALESYQLVIKFDELILVCDETAEMYNEVSLSCLFVLLMKKEDEFSVLIRSRADVTDQNFFTDKFDILEKGYLSIYLLHDEKSFQASSFFLKLNPNNLEFSDSLETLKPWQQETSSYYCLTCGYSASSGVLTAQSSGCYFISMEVTFKRSLGDVNLSIHWFPIIKDEINVFTAVSSVSTSHILKLHVVGFITMDKNTQLSSSFHTSSFGLLVPRGTIFSYTRVSNYPLETCETYIKLSAFISTLKEHSIITEWVPYSSRSLKADNFPLHRSGVYFLSANLITLSSSGTRISFGVLNKLNTLFLATYYSVPDTTFTFLLAGVVLVKTSKVVLSIYMSSNNTATIQSQTTLSLAYIGGIKSPAILLTVKSPESHHWIAFKWVLITAFEEEHVSGFFYKNKVVVPKVTGLYLISAHVIVSVLMPVQLTFGIFVNDELTVTDLKQLISVDTLTVSRSMYLRKGSVVSIMMYSNSETKYQVETRSSFSMVLVEQLGSDIIQMPPVITSELHLGSYLELAVGMECNLECNTVSNTAETFTWYKDNQEITGHNEKILKNCLLGSGFYQCQAKTDNIGPVSIATEVLINEVNECEDKENCKGANMTCIDTPLSYKCDCLYDLKYYGGQCVENVTVQTKSREHQASSIPVTLFVMVPAAVLITILILICSVFLCLKWKKSREDRSDMEFLQLDLTEEAIPMQSLNVSQVLESPDIDKTSTGTSISYSLAISLSANDEDEAEGFEELKWRKLSDASTFV
ncbi:uncharacterized protein LOC100203660 isoform X1 [Hydra vulgaris]|uniref:uncharacterized protein LOC100203660 isoform X1 n=2 Tax=Hydra vulgaris TaxID=6087 RepID=UPI0006413E32|nr:uncharacterized protein LOC100203660 isoform X1 [Hydra vulgaris]